MPHGNWIFLSCHINVTSLEGQSLTVIRVISFTVNVRADPSVYVCVSVRVYVFIQFFLTIHLKLPWQCTIIIIIKMAISTLREEVHTI